MIWRKISWLSCIKAPFLSPLWVVVAVALFCNLASPLLCHRSVVLLAWHKGSCLMLMNHGRAYLRRRKIICISFFYHEWRPMTKVVSEICDGCCTAHGVSGLSLSAFWRLKMRSIIIYRSVRSPISLLPHSHFLRGDKRKSGGQVFQLSFGDRKLNTVNIYSRMAKTVAMGRKIYPKRQQNAQLCMWRKTML